MFLTLLMRQYQEQMTSAAAAPLFYFSLAAGNQRLDTVCSRRRLTAFYWFSSAGKYCCVLMHLLQFLIRKPINNLDILLKTSIFQVSNSFPNF